MPARLEDLLDERRVVLCVGSGGVGKTTITAALGLMAVERGRRVLCLTIDPAKRLAQSFGFESFSTEAQEVAPERLAAAGVRARGSLTIMMLDTKRTFDQLVERLAPDAASRQRIFDNRLYQHVSTGLAGIQSYMAMEKLLSVEQEQRYDLIVLDTPPTTNALDFLDAPGRLIDVLDSPALRWFLEAMEASGRFSLNVVAKGMGVVLKGIGRITGMGFLEQFAQLLADLNALFGGFRRRATLVGEAFRSPRFGYVLVTSPDPAAIQEALFFSSRLLELGMRRDALVVNRVRLTRPGPVDREQVEQAIAELGLDVPPGTADKILQAFADEQQLAALDAAHLATLRQELAAHPIPIFMEVPALAGDVHDVEALAQVKAALGRPASPEDLRPPDGA